MSVLDELVAGAVEDQRSRENNVPLAEVKRMAFEASAPIDARQWLKKADGIPVIAEIKRASPSKGHLSDIPDPAALAREYEQGGASAISVLTEGRRFLGSLEDFDKVRAAVRIPVLRKDFIVTEYQIWEARAHGADLVLLIVAALDDVKLKSLLDLAHSLNMTVLVETHTREEIQRAINAGAKVIGINARNLKDLKVDVNKYNELAADLPDDVIRVAESGVFGSVELEDYARAGADAVLVGEGVATAANHERAVERLVKAGARVKASEQTPLASHEGPYFGQFGGRYVPEALITALDELERVYTEAKADPEFHKELARLNQQYVGRPSPLTEAPRFAQRLEEKTGLDARVFLKREDLNHTGAHKINNALGQALLVKRMGKTRVIAETGAGQHGVATATVCAMLGLKCRIYMGQIDARRQALNVARMRMLGAEVVEVTLGDRILKDAINEALRDWVTNVKDTHYLLGTVAGPHPFPSMVRDFQKIIGEEAKQQLQDWYGIDHPDAICACVGGGSNAIGIMNAFLDDERVNLYGYEAGGNGPESGRHAIRFAPGTGELGMFQGAKSYLLENPEGQTLDTYSISAGLDYASVGPEHAWLKDIGRVNYSWATDQEAMSAFKDLCETEGIIPAIESSHAVAGAYKAAADLKAKGYEHPVMIINISGRGDKDMNTAGKWFGYLTDEQAKALEANGAQGNNADGEETMFDEFKAADKPAFIGYLPYGFPDPDYSLKAFRTMVEHGVNAVEIGLPYSDPVMDGPVIQAASQIAIDNGEKIANVFKAVETVANAGGVPLVMSYWNLIFHYGVERFARDFENAGGAGLITPDLIPDEAGEWIEASDRHGLDRIFLVSPDSTEDRLKVVADNARGFVYAAARMGVTGERSTIDASPKELVARTRKAGAKNVCVGIGVSTAEQGARVGSYADGVIVGSALVHTMLDESGKHAVDEATGLKALAEKTEELAEGIHNARN